MPSFRAASKVVGTGGNATVTEPTGTSQNDILIACFILAGAGTSPASPSGWTNLYSGTSNGSQFKYIVSYIVRGASAPSLTWTLTGSVYREVMLIAVQPASGVCAINAQSASGANVTASSTNPDPPAVTSTKDATLAVCGFSHWQGCVSSGWVAPSGYTKRIDDGPAASASALGTKSLTTAGSDDPGAWTGRGSAGSADIWHGFTIAIEDGSSTGGTAYTLTGAVGAATGAGVASTLKFDRKVIASTGSATAAGVAATVRKGYPITAASGSATGAGVAATLRKHYPLTASVGAATATGLAADLAKGFRLTADVGAATAAGDSATLLGAWKLIGAAGAVTAAGIEAELTYTPAQVAYVLTAQVGSATLEGVVADLTYAPLVQAAPAQQVGGGRRGRFEVYQNVPLYEVEREQRKRLRVIKRRIIRQIHRAERGEVPLPELPQIAQADTWLPSLAREVTEAEQALDRAYQVALQRYLDDEDDVEMLLL